MQPKLSSFERAISHCLENSCFKVSCFILRLLTGRKIYTEKDALEVSRQRGEMCEVSFCIPACSLQFVFNLGVTLASVFSMCFIIEAHTLQAQNISWFSVILLKELPKRAPDKGITVIMSTSV